MNTPLLRLSKADVDCIILNKIQLNIPFIVRKIVAHLHLQGRILLYYNPPLKTLRYMSK
jgi:hypothetical protein